MQKIIFKQLGRQPYTETWQAMQDFTNQRTADTADEIWLLEHPPVFTQGYAGKAEHLLNPGKIPVIQTDRGGQITYHGPGQLVAYLLIDIHRRDFNIRQFVTLIEESIIGLLVNYRIIANTKPKAPGVYVADAKICSLGLRVRRGCTYHGLALNVALDLAPFKRINPCGFQGLTVTQISELGGPSDLGIVSEALIAQLESRL